MENTIQYFLFGNMILVLGIAASYSGMKLAAYIRKHHPDKAREFGCPQDGWYNGFKFANALYKQHDIETPEFVRLKTKTRNCLTGAIIFALAFPLFLVLLVIISVLFTG